MGRKANPTILIIGLENTGKTTILTQLFPDLPEPNTTTPYTEYTTTYQDIPLTIIKTTTTINPQELLDTLKKKKLTNNLRIILVQDITQSQTHNDLTTYINELAPKIKGTLKHNYVYVFGHKIDLLTPENERITKIKFKNTFTSITPPHVHIAFTSKFLPLPPDAIEYILLNESLPETHTSLTQLPLLLTTTQLTTDNPPTTNKPTTKHETPSTTQPTHNDPDTNEPTFPQAKTPTISSLLPDQIEPTTTTTTIDDEPTTDDEHMIWPLAPNVQQALLNALHNTTAIILDPSQQLHNDITTFFTTTSHLTEPPLLTIPLTLGDNNITITYASGIRIPQLLALLARAPSPNTIPVYLIHHTKDPASRIDTLSTLQTIENQTPPVNLKLWVTIYPITTTEQATQVIIDSYQFDDTIAQEIQRVIQGFTSAQTIHELLGMTLAPYITNFPPLIELQSSIREFEEDTLVPYIHLISDPYLFDIEYQNDEIDENLLTIMKRLFTKHAFTQTEPQHEYTEQDVSVIIQKAHPLIIGIGFPVKHKLLYTDVIQYLYEDLQLLAEEWKTHFNTLYTTTIKPAFLALPPSALTTLTTTTTQPAQPQQAQTDEPSKPPQQAQPTTPTPQPKPDETPAPPTKIAILYPFYKETGKPVIPELHDQPQLKNIINQLSEFLSTLSKRITQTPFTTTIDLEDFKIHLRTGEELGIALITNFSRDEAITQRTLTRSLVHTALYTSKTIQTPQDKKRLLQSLEKLYTSYLNPSPS